MVSKTLRATACAVVATALLGGVAHAAGGGRIKDERSSGSGYAAATDASCDIRALTAERSRRSLLVAVTMRGGSSAGSKVGLHVNTRGGPRSDPEFEISRDGAVFAITGVSEQGFPQRAERGRGGVTLAKRGKLVRFTVPLKALRSPKAVAVQAESCGEGAVDIAPGTHYFGRTPDVAHRYLRAVRAERTIAGRVTIDCAGGRRSCRRLAVKDAAVTAKGAGRSFSAVTDERGRYELSVKRGSYTVRARAGALRIKTKPRRLDLTRRTSGSASFQGCGVTGRAGAAAVGGGVWRGGNEACLNYFEIAWRPSSGVRVSWIGIAVCTAPGGRYATAPKLLMKERQIDPSQQGQNVSATDAEVGFFYPINSVHSGNNVNGTLRANGTGSVNARYVEGLCTYGISGLRLRRG